MGLNLRRFLEETSAQVNPFDNGRTAATVRADRNKPAPAQTVSSGGLRVGVAQPQGRVVVDQPQQQPNVVVAPPIQPYRVSVGPAPTTPAIRVGDTRIERSPELTTGLTRASDLGRVQALKQQQNSLLDRIRVFDANTASDRLKRLQNGQAELYQDQQADIGNERAANNVAGALLTNTLRLGNTARAGIGGAYGLGKVGAASVFGSDQDYNDALNGALQTLREDLAPQAGAGGVGTLFDNYEQAQNLGTADLLKKSIGGGVGIAGELAPIPATRAVGGTNLVTRAAKVAGLSGAAGGAADAGNQLVTTGHIDPRQLAVSAAAGAAMGGAAPLVGPTTRLVGRGASATGRAIQAADQAAFTPRVNLADQTVLRDYSDYLAGANPAQGAEANALIAAARDVGDRYGLDLTNGSVADRLDRSNSVLDQLGTSNRQVAQGGYIGREPKPKTQVEPVETAVPEARPLPDKTVPKVQKESQSSNTQLNTSRLDLPEEATARLSKETADVVERLSNKEVKQLAKGAGIDTRNIDIKQTKQRIAKQLNVRNEILTVEKQISDARARGAGSDEIAQLMKKSADLGRTSRAQGTDLGRQLQARRILADELATPQQKLFRLLDEAKVDPDVYTKRLADVDMNNADEVIKAYRDLVPPKFGDWLDKYRYTNMLSSPLTHIVNIASNAQGLLGVAPVQKLYEGAVDAVASLKPGRSRTRYAGEAGAYVKGAVQSLPEAAQKFKDVLTGKVTMDMPDADALKHGKLATGGAAGVADTILSVIPKFLEASDQFAMTASRSGERAGLKYRQGKGVNLKGDIEGQVEDAAKYRVFRQDLGKEGQGAALDAIDWIPKQILAARNSQNPVVRNISKFTIPFVTTPANLFKQGVEYSPLGVVTLSKGNTDKVGSLAKMAMGTTVIGLSAAALASKDAITFSEPADAKQRDAFRAEGKQPYSIKIGNHWVSYSKTHPAIAFNLAVVGAVKDAQDKGALTEDGADKVLRTAAGVLGFFRDQSYMKSVGDFTNSLQLKDGGDVKSALASYGGNVANQVSPFKSMVSWIGRQVDPTQRKVDTTKSAPDQIYQQIIKDIPGLNKNVPARKNPYTGEDIKNDHPVLNSFMPNRITDDKGYGNTTGLSMTDRILQHSLFPDEREAYRQKALDQKYENKRDTQAKDQLKKADGASGKLPSGKYTAKIGDEYKTFDSQDEADLAVTKDNFKKSGKKAEVIGDQYYYKTSSGDVASEPVYKHDYKKTRSATDLSLSRAKRSGDVKAWYQGAQERLEAIENYKNKLDPETDYDEINSLTKEQESLIETYEKYQGYGNNFTKAKKTSAAKKAATSAYKLSDVLGTDLTISKSLRNLLKEATL